MPVHADGTQPRPTRSEILAWLTERRDAIFLKMHQRMRECEQVYHWPSKQGQTAGALGLKGLQKNSVPYLPPIAKIGVDIGVNNTFVGESPIFDVEWPPSKEDEETRQKKKADIIRFLRLWWRQAETYSTETPLRDFGIKGYNQGLGVMAYPFIKERWPAYPLKGPAGMQREPRSGNKKEERLVEEWREKRYRAFPWDVRSCAPTHVFFDPDHDPPEDIIEAYMVKKPIDTPAPILAQPYGSTQDGIAVPVLQIERVTYVSKDWYAVYDGGEPRLGPEDGADSEGVAKNPNGVLWYKMAWAGFGDRTSDGDWAAKGKGLIWDILPVIYAYTMLLNTTLIRAILTSRTPYHLKGPDDVSAKQKAEEMAAGPDAVFPTGPGYSIDAFPSVPWPPQVEWAQNEFNGLLELWFGPNILRGQHTEDTAAGLRTRYAHAKAIYRAMTQNSAQAIAAISMDVLWMIKHQIKEEMTAWGAGEVATLSPDDIPAGIWVTVDLTPPSEEEKAFATQEASRRYDEGTLDLVTMLERSGEDDPSKMVKAIFKDGIKKHPMVQEAFAQKLVERFLRGAMMAQEIKAHEEAEAGNMPIRQNGQGEPLETMPGLTLAGEQRPPPIMGSPEDMLRGVGIRMPPLAGAAPR